MADNTHRFTYRVSEYIDARPDYPKRLIDDLIAAIGARGTVADIGSGTGQLASQLLVAGAAVIGVEPNDAMREAAEDMLGGFQSFTSVAGSAEATNLETNSVALITAAQAYHWFDTEAARREFRRIGEPGATIALIWNDRDVTATPFDAAYEKMLRGHCESYRESKHRRMNQDLLESQFGVQVELTEYPHAQRLTRDGLVRRLHSASYVPKSGPGSQGVMERALELFDTHCEGNCVRLHFTTRAYWISLGA